MSCRTKLKNQRPKAFWGAIIGSLVSAGIGAAASIYNNNKMAKIQQEQADQQKRLAEQQAILANNTNIANSLNSYADSVNQQQDEDEKYSYRTGGKVIAGGRQVRVSPRLSLLRGNLHGQPNSIGGDGITMDFKGKQIDAQNNEVVYNKNKNTSVIFSNEPELGEQGYSPAELALLGVNPDRVTNVQTRNKRRLGLYNANKDNPKAKWGMSVTKGDYIRLGADLLTGLGGYFASSLSRPNINYDIDLPEYVDSGYVSAPTDWDNAAERREVKRTAALLRQEIAANSSNSREALNRMQSIHNNEGQELSKLYETRANKRTELINDNANREQTDRTERSRLKLEAAKARADLQMRINQQKYENAMASTTDFTNLAQSIGASVNNFVDSASQRFHDENSLKAYLAASGPGTASSMIALGYDFSPRMLQSIYDAQKTYYEANPNDKDALTRYNIAGRALYGDSWGKKISNTPTLSKVKPAATTSNLPTTAPVSNQRPTNNFGYYNELAERYSPVKDYIVSPLRPAYKPVRKPWEQSW